MRARWSLTEEKAPGTTWRAQYLMGHAVDPLDYNKAYRDEDYTQSLYIKAEPWLNVLSEEPDKISTYEVSRYQADETLETLRLRIEELELEIEKKDNFTAGLKLRNASTEAYDRLSEEAGVIEEKEKALKTRKALQPHVGV